MLLVAVLGCVVPLDKVNRALYFDITALKEDGCSPIPTTTSSMMGDSSIGEG